MRIRPHITLLFLLSVFTILLLTSIFIPQEGLTLFGNIKIKFFDPKELFNPSLEYADISNIIALNEPSSDSILSMIESDSIPIAIDTIRADADSLKQSIRKFEFPNNDKTILYQVFRSLEKANSGNKVVRIMHYGDSQIEGDRITSFLRNRFQNKFGGRGVGMLPARQLYDFSFSVFHDASENWNRYTLYGKRDTLITHKRYGIIAGFNSFTKQPIDTLLIDSTKKSAWISVTESPYSYRNTKTFSQCRLFYGNSLDSIYVKLSVSDEVVDEGIYAPTKELKQIQWLFDEPVNNITINIEGVNSPEIYGLALDGKNGVAVDNIAMRGNAGLVFNKMDPVLFKQMVKKLNVKLMILQFGGNVVPNIRKDYSYYERWFYAQLKFIKTHAPEVEIIVIGLSDMSIKNNSHYESYPNIELVRDALKKATFKANAVYWDMYEAMGGQNSMPSWVFAQPALASKDFVHFTPRGAKIVANMFYNAFMYEYTMYKRNNPVLPEP
jgi:hypothetical protein